MPVADKITKNELFLTTKFNFMNVKAKGYILGAVAAATYGMNPLFALPLYKAGMNPDSVLFFRYLFAIPVLGMMIVARGRSFKLKRKEVLPLIIMGLLVALSSLALFQSYNYMDVGIASTLLFVYPILVALIMWIAFKEKLTLPTVLCILLALGGIGLLYKSGDGSTLNLTGIILVMISALSYAIYIVGVNLIALAIFPTAISFLCTTQAIQYIGSTPTAILGALEPLTAVFFGVVVFGESLTLRLSCGMLMIILAVTLIIAGGNITIYLVRFRKLFPRLPIKRKK